jgi:hypothetical protein
MIIAIAAKFILTFSTVCRYIIHMGKKDDSAYIEDWAQIDAREELAPKIRETLRGYRDKRQLSSIARQLGFHQSRLTEMITKNENGEYKIHGSIPSRRRQCHPHSRRRLVDRRYRRKIPEVPSGYIRRGAIRGKSRLYSSIENLALWTRSEPIGSAIKNR